MSSLQSSANHFLASLSSHDGELIKPHLRPLELPNAMIFYKEEDTITQLYFPESGVVSLTVGFTNGQFVEAGMIGRNGVVGVAAALDGGIAINQAISPGLRRRTSHRCQRDPRFGL